MRSLHSLTPRLLPLLAPPRTEEEQLFSYAMTHSLRRCPSARPHARCPGLARSLCITPQWVRLLNNWVTYIYFIWFIIHIFGHDWHVYPTNAIMENPKPQWYRLLHPPTTDGTGWGGCVATAVLRIRNRLLVKKEQCKKSEYLSCPGGKCEICALVRI